MRSGNKNMATKNYITQNSRSMNKFSLMSVNVIERNGSDCKYVEIFIIIICTVTVMMCHVRSLRPAGDMSFLKYVKGIMKKEKCWRSQ
jgi:hypothetical protein